MEEKLSFVDFLKTYFKEYQIDGHNLQTIESIGLWAIRDPKFNNQAKAWHIDKGICLLGNTGSGKTTLFRLLNHYLNYLKSTYSFSSKVVWMLASDFEADGYSCFNEILKFHRNIYFEELCMTDDSELPNREIIGHYANKALIGREIIMMMYNKFMETAYQTHFCSNAGPQDMERVYGERAFSRMHEMCNFMVLVGLDRRKSEMWAPKFKKNLNQPVAPKPVEADANADAENKAILEGHYIDFLEGKNPSTNMSLVYNSLVAYGVKVATDNELRDLMEDIAKTYVSEAPLTRSTPSEKEKIKNAWIWEQSRKAAVGIFFQKMKNAGAKSIFGVRNVDDKDLPALVG